VRDQIHDEQLQKDISGFIGQEAHHARAHEQFNQLVQSSEYHLKNLKRLMSRR
jgi:predicted metal-dependent hydrolase